MRLKPFQQATVQHAVQRLTDESGSGRFLVADEVGLGKTLVAQGIMQELAENTEGHPLRVFYICSSLSIAEQNAEELLRLPEGVLASRVPVDRLTLLPVADAQDPKASVHLYTLTPGTLPGQSRLGNFHERALLLALLVRALPELKPKLRRNGRLYGELRSSAERSFDGAVANAHVIVRDLPSEFVRRFRHRMRDQFNATRGDFQPLAEHCWTSTQAWMVEQRMSSDALDTIHQLRFALCRAALGTAGADLIILDEFQRFFELFAASDGPSLEDGDVPDDTAASIMRHILEGSDVAAPRVLLLSATPYRPFGSWKDGSHGQHSREFYELLLFLFGGRKAGLAALEKRRQVERLFEDYSRALREDACGSERVLHIRDELQHLLGRVMARTERLAGAHGPAQDPVEVVEVPLQPEDAFIYRHLADAARTDSSGAGAYWSSIPLPLQMMPRSDYNLSRDAEPGPVPATRADRVVLTEEAVRRYGEAPAPHPRLRGLMGDLPPELLELPWLPPTLPWWPNEGCFQKAEAWANARPQKGEEPPSAARSEVRPRSTSPWPLSKVLVFSRFRAVPRALSTLISFEAERAAYAGKSYDYQCRRGDNEPDLRLRKQPERSFEFSGKSGRRTALMFLPHPMLAELGDPRRLEGFGQLAKSATDFTLDRALGEITDRLRARLGVGPAAPKRRPLHRWAAKLELHHERFDATMAGWRNSLDEIDEDTEAAGEVVERYPEAGATEELPSEAELRELAEHALLAPGNILWRAYARVVGQPSASDWEQRTKSLTTISVDALRGYLDTPEFHVTLKQEGVGHPANVRRAAWDGNLEAVLDEYLNLLFGLGSREAIAAKEEARAAQTMTRALNLRASTLSVQELPDTSRHFRMRCHAALPLGIRDREERSGENLFRSDYLRHAFNSPFRPHVLVTTSIGQEGLDFHRYCQHIVHWDLPTNPVDLEQRDGRIRRYGGLNVRRALVETRTAPEAAVEPGKSPWRALTSALEEQDEGLSPWWNLPGARTRRTVYVAPFSRVRRELDELLAALALYRLTLGQADQERLLEALRRRLEHEDASASEWFHAARLNLAPGLSAPTRGQDKVTLARTGRR